MNCIYFKRRSKNYKYYLYCNKLKKEITWSDCKNCDYKEYKKVEHSKTQQKVSENTAKTQRNTAKAVALPPKSGSYTRKAVKVSVKSGSIKQRTSKQAKLERDRFSIFTDDLDVCYICKNKRDDLHEIFMGAKRLTSIRYGLVLPLCRLHHLEMHNNSETRLQWNIIGQKKAMQRYSWDIDKFIEIFGKNYLD